MLASDTDVEFLEGNALDVTVEFRVADMLTDPTTVTFKMRRADVESPTALIFGTDADVKRDAQGKFRYSGQFAPGTWLYWWIGTGLAEATTKGRFRVVPLDTGVR